MSYQLGDVVRLIRGWTPMIVIGIHTDQMTAKYANNPWSLVTEWNYQNPHQSDSCYTRSFSGFTRWDGCPSKIVEGHYFMPRTYRVKATPTDVGILQGTTSTGEMILEIKGTIQTFQPHELVEDIPRTMKVKAANNNHYSAHYRIPEDSDIERGEFLMSESGNLYVVTDENSSSRSPKGEFKGRRLVTSAL